MEKWDVNVTNIFFPKLPLITVFDERKYCSKQFSKIIIYYIASGTSLLNQNGILAKVWV